MSDEIISLKKHREYLQKILQRGLCSENVDDRCLVALAGSARHAVATGAVCTGVHHGRTASRFLERVKTSQFLLNGIYWTLAGLALTAPSLPHTQQEQHAHAQQRGRLEAANEAAAVDEEAAIHEAVGGKEAKAVDQVARVGGVAACEKAAASAGETGTPQCKLAREDATTSEKVSDEVKAEAFPVQLCTASQRKQLLDLVCSCKRSFRLKNNGKIKNTCCTCGRAQSSSANSLNCSSRSSSSRDTNSSNRSGIYCTGQDSGNSTSSSETSSSSESDFHTEDSDSDSDYDLFSGSGCGSGCGSSCGKKEKMLCSDNSNRKKVIRSNGTVFQSSRCRGLGFAPSDGNTRAKILSTLSALQIILMLQGEGEILSLQEIQEIRAFVLSLQHWRSGSFFNEYADIPAHNYNLEIEEAAETPAALAELAAAAAHAAAAATLPAAQLTTAATTASTVPPLTLAPASPTEASIAAHEAATLAAEAAMAAAVEVSTGDEHVETDVRFVLCALASLKLLEILENKLRDRVQETPEERQRIEKLKKQRANLRLFEKRLKELQDGIYTTNSRFPRRDRTGNRRRGPSPPRDSFYSGPSYKSMKRRFYSIFSGSYSWYNKDKRRQLQDTGEGLANSWVTSLQQRYFCTKRLVNWLFNCQNFDGGFGCAPECESHAGTTFCSVASLALIDRIDALSYVQLVSLKRWLSERQQQNGGLNGRPGKPADCCYAWWVVASLAMLRFLPDAHINTQQLRRYIEACQSPLGGICRSIYKGIAKPSHRRMHARQREPREEREKEDVKVVDIHGKEGGSSEKSETTLNKNEERPDTVLAAGTDRTADEALVKDDNSDPLIRSNVDKNEEGNEDVSRTSTECTEETEDDGRDDEEIVRGQDLFGFLMRHSTHHCSGIAHYSSAPDPFHTFFGLAGLSLLLSSQNTDRANQHAVDPGAAVAAGGNATDAAAVSDSKNSAAAADALAKANDAGTRTSLPLMLPTLGLPLYLLPREPKA